MSTLEMFVPYDALESGTVSTYFSLEDDNAGAEKLIQITK